MCTNYKKIFIYRTGYRVRVRFLIRAVQHNQQQDRQRHGIQQSKSLEMSSLKKHLLRTTGMVPTDPLGWLCA